MIFPRVTAAAAVAAAVRWGLRERGVDVRWRGCGSAWGEFGAGRGGKAPNRFGASGGNRRTRCARLRKVRGMSPGCATLHSSPSCRTPCCGCPRRRPSTAPLFASSKTVPGCCFARRSKTDQAGRGPRRFLGPPTVARIRSWIEAAGIDEGLPSSPCTAAGASSPEPWASVRSGASCRPARRRRASMAACRATRCGLDRRSPLRNATRAWWRCSSREGGRRRRCRPATRGSRRPSAAPWPACATAPDLQVRGHPRKKVRNWGCIRIFRRANVRKRDLSIL